MGRRIDNLPIQQMPAYSDWLFLPWSSPFSLREGALSPVILGCGSDPHPEARTSKNADIATITIVRRNISVASSTIDDGYGSATAIPSWKPVKAIQVLKSIFGEMRCT